MTHTKEPWDSSGNTRGLVKNRGDGTSFHLARFEMMSDLHRAQDCVNALAGIQSPQSFVEAAKDLANCVKAMREAQDAYMKAREERGGKDRVYDNTLRELGIKVACMGINLDLALTNFESALKGEK